MLRHLIRCEALKGVEYEHCTQQRRRLDGAQPLFLERVGQLIDLRHRKAQCIPVPGPSTAYGKVSLTERPQHVGERQEGVHHPSTSDPGEAEPEGYHQQA